MKKLRLELEDLAVESFVTSRDPRGRGTVLGHRMAPIETRYLWQCGQVSWDIVCVELSDLDCYTADGGGTCKAVYTCPECASPPQSYDYCLESVDLCVADQA